VRSRSLVAIVPFCVVACWYDIGDVATTATDITTTGGAFTTTQTGAGGEATTGGGANAGGQGGLGQGGVGQGGVAQGGFGGGPLELLEGPFTSCQDTGFVGECAGNHLLVYFREEHPCNADAATDVCILNRCAFDGGGTCYLDACGDNRCNPMLAPADAIVCGETVLPEGDCFDGVAVRRASATNCNFKDCLELGGTCVGPPMVAAADCYAK
jgi:hypothetical protein